MISGPGGCADGSLCAKHGVPMVGTITEHVLCAVCEQARADRIVDALRQSLYALTWTRKALDAWRRPIAGMGANIQQEDRGRVAYAYREEAKARQMAEEFL